MAAREDDDKFQKAFELFDTDGTGRIRCVKLRGRFWWLEGASGGLSAGWIVEGMARWAMR